MRGDRAWSVAAIAFAVASLAAMVAVVTAAAREPVVLVVEVATWLAVTYAVAATLWRRGRAGRG